MYLPKKEKDAIADMAYFVQDGLSMSGDSAPFGRRWLGLYLYFTISMPIVNMFI